MIRTSVLHKTMNVVFLWLQIRLQLKNAGRIDWLWLPQIEHIHVCGNFVYIYYVVVNDFIITTVKLSKIWLDYTKGSTSKKLKRYNDQNKRDNQWSTKLTIKNITENLRWSSGKRCSSCSTSGVRPVTVGTYQLTSHVWIKDRIVNTTEGPYPWSYVTQIYL